MALLIGLVGGLVLGGLAGARRTDTAVDRLIAATAAADVLVNPEQGDESALDYAQVAALPMVDDFSRIQGVGFFPPGPYDSFEVLFSSNAFASDGGSGFRFNRPVVNSGRLSHPDAADEVFLERTYAMEQGISVGDTVTWRTIGPDAFGVANAMFEHGDFEGGFATLGDPAAGTDYDFHVVGIGTWLDSVAVDEGYEPAAVLLGPAAFERVGRASASYGGAVVRLSEPADLDAFRDAVSALAPDEKIVFQTMGVSRDKAIRATQPAAIALAMFAGVAALLGLLIVGQAISRRFQLDARDNRTFAALGSTDRQRFGAGMIRLVLAATVGTALAVVLGFVTSVFTPVGPASFADPDPGIQFNASVLIGGFAVLLSVIVLVGTLPAWHGAQLTAAESTPTGSRVAGWLSSKGASVSTTTGVRFGLEPGRGSTAVPTRATIIGAATAITVAAATIVFASSLDRVAHDGRFYGSNFDAFLDFEGDVSSDDSMMADAIELVSGDPSVVAASELRIAEMRLDGDPGTALAFTGGTGSVPPTIAAGRAPSAVDEIALGSTTMRDLGVGIGDRVSVSAGGYTGDSEIVGRVVLPGVGLYQGSDRTSVGVGALVTPEVMGPRNEATKSFVVVDLDSAGEVPAFADRMNVTLGELGGVSVQPTSRPADIASLARLRSLPVVLSGLIVLMVGVTVVHAMVVAVRRRRRDVAILQALGSTSRSVMAIGVWQGLTVGIAGVLFGVPLGVIAGRWCWTLLANAFGTLAEPVVPLPGLFVLVVSVLVLAAVAGVLPMRRGLRHHPADVLRSE